MREKDREGGDKKGVWTRMRRRKRRQTFTFFFNTAPRSTFETRGEKVGLPAELWGQCVVTQAIEPPTRQELRGEKERGGFHHVVFPTQRQTREQAEVLACPSPAEGGKGDRNREKQRDQRATASLNLTRGISRRECLYTQTHAVRWILNSV